MQRAPALILGLLLALSAQWACAAAVLTSSRSAIGPGYSIDWGTLGPEFTAVAPGTSVGPATISGAPTFTLFSGSTFNADFAPGDTVLALFDISSGNPVSGLFRIDFAAPVKAAGAQVQANLFGAFSGFISAYNSSSLLLGTFAVNGSNSGNGDDSAVFAGIISDTFNIARLEFTGFGDGAGINDVSVQNAPEPSLLLALLLGFGAMASVRRGARR